MEKEQSWITSYFIARTLDPVVTGDWVTLHKDIMKSCFVLVVALVIVFVLVFVFVNVFVFVMVLVSLFQ